MSLTGPWKQHIAKVTTDGEDVRLFHIDYDRRERRYSSGSRLSRNKLLIPLRLEATL